MAINYPIGTAAGRFTGDPRKKNTRILKKKTEFGNRGMSFEEDINQTNQYYLAKSIAVIHKKPTPIQVVSVDYPKRSAAVITEAYYKEASTTDYNGVYQGRYIDFEAKETKNTTSFPLRNFHQHQIDHMKQCLSQNGVVFVLLWFSSLKRCFLLPAEDVIDCWDKHLQNSRKSIPLTLIESAGYEISLGIAPRIPYLAVLDEHML
ncbi:Holliday junction resolvase RecU [Vagococcus acidifermentans]|uniref:Holliday junction resolvase RecU n=1 Tax=Vagococcus acidifermentans TaxID=564710 RepID=UPI00248278AA|nr:Holliday junction resolvase RecU [Vagococcus acidifermentans]